MRVGLSGMCGDVLYAYGACVVCGGTQVMQDKGDLDGALDFMQQALAIQRKALGDEHPRVAVTLFNIGMVRLVLVCVCVCGSVCLCSA